MLLKPVDNAIRLWKKNQSFQAFKSKLNYCKVLCETFRPELGIKMTSYEHVSMNDRHPICLNTDNPYTLNSVLKIGSSKYIYNEIVYIALQIALISQKVCRFRFAHSSGTFLCRIQQLPLLLNFPRAVPPR